MSRFKSVDGGRMGVDFYPVFFLVFDTWGGLRGAWKAVLKAIFARCTACLLPGARPVAVRSLRRGLSVQLGHLAERQLDDLTMVTTETLLGGGPHSRLPPHALQRAGNPRLQSTP